MRVDEDRMENIVDYMVEFEDFSELLTLMCSHLGSVSILILIESGIIDLI